MIDLAGRTIAIIGGAGFIGHHLALELVEQGADVHVVDGLQVNNLAAIRSDALADGDRELYLSMLEERLELLRQAKVHLHIQDARDYHALSRLLNEIGPSVLVQAAAVAHAGKSNKDPYSTFDHSLRTLENALDWARSGNVEHFVYLSSSMAYGDFETQEVDEEHPLNPVGIYGALKVAGEKIVIAYQQVFELPYTIVRPSALYGPRCVSRRVIQVFIENAMQGEVLRVQGDGSDRLDFTYIEDFVDGLARVIQHPAARNEIFNMTYGSARTILDAAALVQERFPGLEIVHSERDRLMPERGTLSVEKARSLIGYEPRNPLEMAVPTYIDWYHALAGASSLR
jgi:nucleoside-diphosphate-sugar epimerase